MTVRSLWIGMALSAVGWTGLSAAEFRVPADFPTIQAGVDAAAAGDTVLVAPGTYTDFQRHDVVGPRDLCVLLKDGVTLLSESGPAGTTIDMQGQGTSQLSVIFGYLLASGQTVVEGFTITGIFPGRAGVFLVDTGTVTFKDCILRDMDGGINPGGIAASGNVELMGCEFLDLRGNASVAVVDAGILVDDCLFSGCSELFAINFNTFDVTSSVVRNSVFINNMGGTAAVNLQTTTATVADCYFEGNTFVSTGGLFVGVTGTWSVTDCTFLNNACTGTGCLAGGLYAGGASGTVSGCTFEESSAQFVFGGTAVTLSLGPVLFTNNAVSNSQGGFAVRKGSGVLTSTCNVFWDNPAGHTSGFSLGATDRIADPLYCDVLNGDLTVQSDSPCLPANSLGCGQIGALGEGCGAVSVTPRSWGRIKGAYR